MMIKKLCIKLIVIIEADEENFICVSFLKLRNNKTILFAFSYGQLFKTNTYTTKVQKQRIIRKMHFFSYEGLYLLNILLLLLEIILCSLNN